MTRVEKRVQYGAESGSILTLLMVGLSAFFLWITIQAATTIVGVLFLGLFIWMFGGFFMDTTAKGGKSFIMNLLGMFDTRNRVIAMEDYHGIDYTVIPEKRLYVKHGHTCELVVKEIA